MKVLYDTCLYIDFLRSAKNLELFDSRFHIRFLSPIVIMELNAGATTPQKARLLDKLYHPYSKAGRIVALTANEFYRAGEILKKISRLKRNIKKGFSHDILIALSAHSLGATLYTNNQNDYELIRKFLPFKLQIVL